jgi:anti-sigma regulatory factor (Ser/Thr protein kinase)
MLELSLELESQLEAGQRARQVLAERLRDELSGDVFDALLTVVTELVNNSVQHGPGEPIQVQIVVEDDGSVRGEVEDQGDGQVAVREMGERGSGLGLLIVTALTDRWAVHEGSTTVWFEIGPEEPRGGLFADARFG